MIEKIRERWQDILDYIQNEYEIVNVSFNTWIRPLVVSSMNGDTLSLLYPDADERVVVYLTRKYQLFFQVAIEEITGVRCSVRFVKEAEPEKAPAFRPQKKSAGPSFSSEANLNPRYTFDSFVIGANNKFAHAASLAVAESPGEMYNPLFIHGGVGLGKTHLMHSIAHFVLKNNPNAKIVYVSSEQFTYELIDAIRNKNNFTISEFREKYRNVDVLLIDDIQFIVGKESTQEEFFHTFNVLYDNNKQIVLSSDKPPKDFETLEERLRSRFEMGLQVDISSPDYETRMAILRKKEELEGYTIDNEILKYVATNIKSNIRELEGAMNKIIAYSRLYGTNITMDVAMQALQDLISPDAQREVTVDYIIQVVAEHFNFTSEELSSPKRNKELVYPRQIAMYLCRQLTSESLQSIGTALSRKDHTTVIHGVKTIETDLENDENLKNTIEILKKKILPN